MRPVDDHAATAAEERAGDMREAPCTGRASGIAIARRPRACGRVPLCFTLQQRAGSDAWASDGLPLVSTGGGIDYIHLHGFAYAECAERSRFECHILEVRLRDVAMSRCRDVARWRVDRLLGCLCLRQHSSRTAMCLSHCGRPDRCEKPSLAMRLHAFPPREV